MDKWLNRIQNIASNECETKTNEDVKHEEDTLAPSQAVDFQACDSTSSSESELNLEYCDEDVDILGEKVNNERKNVRIAPGPKDLSSLPTDSPCQPYRSCYQGHNIGGKERRFNAAWFKVYNWLEYSLSQDAAYCFICRHFSVDSQNKKNAFVSMGFRSWNRATGKDPKSNALLMHKNSEVHLTSVEKYESFKSMNQNCLTVVKMVDKAHADFVSENRHYLKTIADILRLTCTQNISQRGHNEKDSSFNRGNFLEILNLVAKHDKIVYSRLNGPGNAKYTHSSVQNAILTIIEELIVKDIKEEITEAKYYSIIADESKDLSKKEQLTLVLRYVYKGLIHEEFLGFTLATDLTSNGLKDFIVNNIEKWGIDIKDCVSQAYDGAAVMSGKIKGVQTQIREIVDWALYVHCFAHQLNLVVVDTSKSIREASDFFAVLSRLYNFISGSYVHNLWINIQKEKFPNQATVELKRLADTRWASHVSACNAVYEKLSSIIHLLDTICNDSNRDRACEAKSIKALVDFNFIFLLHVFKDLLKEVKIVSCYLQNPSMNYCEASDLIKNMVETLENMRSAKQCSEYIQLAKTLCIKYDINDICQLYSQRKRKPPTNISDAIITENIGLVNNISDIYNEDDYIRKSIFLPIIDKALVELNSRFSSGNMGVLTGICAFNPRSHLFLKYETLKKFAEHYKSNLLDCELEIKQLSRLVMRKKENLNFECNTIMDMLEFLEKYEDAFYELKRLIKIACTIPVSTAEAERSFSSLKLIKTHLRTTMTDSRLSSISVISVHKERAKNIDLERVIDLFVNLFPNCRIVLK